MRKMTWAVAVVSMMGFGVACESRQQPLEEPGTGGGGFEEPVRDPMFERDQQMQQDPQMQDPQMQQDPQMMEPNTGGSGQLEEPFREEQVPQDQQAPGAVPMDDGMGGSGTEGGTPGTPEAGDFQPQEGQNEDLGGQEMQQ